MSKLSSPLAMVAGVLATFGLDMSPAAAGVVPAVSVPEPMSMALLGAGVGALYLVKKLRG